MSKRIAALIAALLMVGTLVVPAAAEDEDADAGDGDDRFPTEPVVVGTQNAGTFGGGGAVGDAGAALGMDLLEGRISMPDADTVRFEIEVTDLPPTGGTPEVPRYTWDMTIDGEVAQLDGKFTNYSRGMCDPTSGQCDPTDDRHPRDPGLQPFFFRGNCGEIDFVVMPFNACEELDVIQAEFDADADTITIDVPVESIDLLDDVTYDDCSTITPMNADEGAIVARASAFLSFSGGAVGGATSDGIFGFHDFVAPHAADAEVDCAGDPIEDDGEDGDAG